MLFSPDSRNEEISPRFAEANLWKRLDAILDGDSADSDFAQPIRIVAPTRGLRDHLALALLHHRGRAVLGVRVQTLYGLAAEILERASSSIVRGDLFFSWLVRKWGREDATLGPLLSPFKDGWNLVTQSVGVLLDAGLNEAHLRGISDWFVGPGTALGRDQSLRLKALIRLSLAAKAGLREAHYLRSNDLLRIAEEKLAAEPSLLPCRAVFLHHFNPNSALEADLLALLGEIFPPPWLSRSSNVSVASQPMEMDDVDASRLGFLEAEDIEAEVKEVVCRVIDLQAGGMLPEKMAIVLPTGERYPRLLRHSMKTLGVPFSGPGLVGSLKPRERVNNALVTLFEDGGTMALDQWFELNDLSEFPLQEDSRLAWRIAGLARLKEAAVFEPSLPTNLPLCYLVSLDPPVAPCQPGEQMSIRFGPPNASAPVSADPEIAECTSASNFAASKDLGTRTVSAEDMKAAAEEIRILLEMVRQMPVQGTLEDYENWMLHLLEKGLGWTRVSDHFLSVAGIAQRLVGSFPPGLTLKGEEFREVFRLEVCRRKASPFGGRGGGVQVLSLAESWGRTFEWVGLLGLTQGEFPSPLAEDPLLPDGLRAPLQVLLPDLPLRAERGERVEVQYRSLLWAAPQVLLCRPLIDAKGRELSASPFWRRERSLPGVRKVESPRSEGMLQSTFKTLVGKSRLEGRDFLGRALDRWARITHGSYGTKALSARLQALEELDPRPETAMGQARWRNLGPFFGRVGGDGGKPLYVTQLENILQCSWRNFLTKRLEVQPIVEPVGYLSSVNAAWVGRVLHAVLDRWVRKSLYLRGKTLAEVIKGHGKNLSWPEAGRWETWVLEESRKVTAAHGFSFLAGALAARTLFLLEKAQKDLNGISALGAEVSGDLTVREGDRELPLFFRADLVDQKGSTLRITDYKTGRKPRQSSPKALLQQGSLQAMVYALAVGKNGEGRYLYLGSEEAEEVTFSADEEWTASFESTVATLIQGSREGVAIPRFLSSDLRKNHSQCAWCEVAPACLYLDSTSHRRWARWVEKVEAMGGPNPWEGLAFRLWSLGGGA